MFNLVDLLFGSWDFGVGDSKCVFAQFYVPTFNCEGAAVTRYEFDALVSHLNNDRLGHNIVISKAMLFRNVVEGTLLESKFFYLGVLRDEVPGFNLAVFLGCTFINVHGIRKNRIFIKVFFFKVLAFVYFIDIEGDFIQSFAVSTLLNKVKWPLTTIIGHVKSYFVVFYGYLVRPIFVHCIRHVLIRICSIRFKGQRVRNNLGVLNRKANLSRQGHIVFGSLGLSKGVLTIHNIANGNKAILVDNDRSSFTLIIDIAYLRHGKRIIRIGLFEVIVLAVKILKKELNARINDFFSCLRFKLLNLQSCRKR